MTIFSRTPEGRPNRCGICGKRLRLSASWPASDAPCPHCGALVFFWPGETYSPPTLAQFRFPEWRLSELKRQFDAMRPMPRDEKYHAGLSHEVLDASERELRRVCGILDAMTRQELEHPKLLNASRYERIAAGAGVSPETVTGAIESFRKIQEITRAWNEKRAMA